jgi:alkylhydroperoxidase/carboxymuconolactone decarboxylase family protein YurZ
MDSSTNGSTVLDLLKDMTASSLDATSLDERTLMLVRIAALVAIDAPAVSYAMNLEAAGDVGVDADEVRGVLAGIAPVVGTARVVSATTSIAKALAIELDIAEQASQG